LRSVAATPGAISARYIQPNTEQDYRQKLGAAVLFFGEMTLGEIHWYHMKSYQAARVAGDPPFIRKRQPHEPPSRPHPGDETAIVIFIGLIAAGVLSVSRRCGKYREDRIEGWRRPD
jgi:hypothetical protein